MTAIGGMRQSAEHILFSTSRFPEGIDNLFFINRISAAIISYCTTNQVLPRAIVKIPRSFWPTPNVLGPMLIHSLKIPYGSPEIAIFGIEQV
jgi:hypothetical protein